MVDYQGRLFGKFGYTMLKEWLDPSIGRKSVKVVKCWAAAGYVGADAGAEAVDSDVWAGVVE